MAPRLPYSTGCYSCRRMKVKCDAIKPSCTRCVRAGRVCPGYRDLGQTLFRSMNASTTSKTAHETAATGSSSAVTNPHGGDIVLRLSPPLPTAWEVNAAAFFLKGFVQPPRAGFPGYMSYLPGLLADTHGSLENHHLHEAVLAAGCANLANVSGLSHLSAAARSHYGRALRTLATALSDPARACSDITLSAIMMLQMYEVVSGSYTAVDPHSDGLSELIRLRGLDKFQSPESKELLGMIQGRRKLQDLEQQGQGVNQQAPLSSGTREDLRPIYEGPQVQSPSPMVLFQLMDDASRACGQLRSVVLRPSASSPAAGDISLSSGKRWLRSDLLAMVDQVYSLHLELLTWRNAVPELLRYRVHHVSSRTYASPSQSVFTTNTIPNDPDPEDECVFPSRYYIFQGAQHGALWLGYWCTHMHLLHTLGEALRRLSVPLALPAGQIAMLLQMVGSRLYAAIDDICASVPYMMGEIAERRHPDPASRGRGASGPVRDKCPERQRRRVPATAQGGKRPTGAQGGPGRESPARGNNALGSLFLLRSLYVVVQIAPDLSGSQREYVLAALTRIGHAKGIALALTARDRWSGHRNVEMNRLPLVH